jgi:F0F1-type ATP synthase delta subunit
MTTALLSGTQRSLVIKQLAAYLVESRRTKELDLIIRDVNYMLSQQGVVSATLTSAFALTAETQKAIERFIVAKTKASKLSIDTQIEPKVLGGVKISLPGSELDQTIAHQLTALKTRFKKA